MFNSSEQALTRRALLHRVGKGLIVLSGIEAVQVALPPTHSSTLAVEKTSSKLPMPSEKKSGWAIVGLGKFATKQIIPSFADCKYSKLVALVSGSPDKAQRIAKQHDLNPENIYNYDNYDTIRDNPEVDIIYIILPNGLHAQYTIRGAEAGKHIMCEKPMANTPEECEAMIDACKKADRKLMIAYRAQYEPYNLAAIDIARGKKELGRLKVIVANNGRHLNPDDPADQWRMNKKLAGGGSLPDIGIYSLQAARYITGEEPTEISAMIYSTPDDPRFKEVEETVNFLLRFPSGVLANCTSSYGHASASRYQVFGEDGIMELDPATPYSGHRIYVNNEERKIEGQNQFAQEMDHLSQCVIENKNPKTPGEEGLQDVKLIQTIYEAAQKGETIKLPHTTPSWRDLGSV